VKIWHAKVIYCLCFLCLSSALLAQSSDKVLNQAQQAYQKGNYGEAVSLYRQLLQQKPDYPPALFYLGMALVKSGKGDAGFAYMEKAVEISPSFTWHFAIAEMAQRQGNTKEAIRHYEACLKFRQDTTIYDDLAALYQESGDVAKASYCRSQRVIAEIPKVRKLQFKSKVEIGVKTREELKQFLIRSLDEELPADKAAAMQAAMLAFGFITTPIDFRQFYIALLTEQIAGFYDPETKQLYVIAESREPNFLEELIKDKQDGGEERMVMAHELTHALQDQYFDLQTLEKKVKANDDRTLALQSLIEGDATLAMLDYQIAPGCYTSEHREILRILFSLQGLLAIFMGGKELANAPAIIRETLLFPYMEGLFFCLTLRGKNAGYKATDAAFAKVPASTEQILHPAKYTENEQPWDFVLLDFSESLGSGWKQVENNVLGELALRVLLQEYKIAEWEKVAAGWGGDRYSVLRADDGKLSLIWLTVWDSKQDAEEFFAAYQKVLRHKHGGANPEKSGYTLTWQANDKASRLSLESTRVYVVEQISRDKLDELWQKTQASQVLCPQASAKDN
jgi:heme-degrading monooxygenase HmoA